MDKKSTEVVNNICTILGGALLLYPLIEEATKTIIPEMQKLTSSEMSEELKMLPDKQGNEHKEKENNEISDLKRKLAELEGKSSEHKE